MPEVPAYALATVLTLLGVLLLELCWLRTGLLRRAQYWISLAIMLFFQVLVDGFLTRLSDPVVRYAPEKFSGIRAPLDIPVEDFGFGIAVITLVLMLWSRRTSTARADVDGAHGPMPDAPHAGPAPTRPR